MPSCPELGADAVLSTSPLQLVQLPPQLTPEQATPEDQSHSFRSSVIDLCGSPDPAPATEPLPLGSRAVLRVEPECPRQDNAGWFSPPLSDGGSSSPSQGAEDPKPSNAGRFSFPVSPEGSPRVSQGAGCPTAYNAGRFSSPLPDEGSPRISQGAGCPSPTKPGRFSFPLSDGGSPRVSPGAGRPTPNNAGRWSFPLSDEGSPCMPQGAPTPQDLMRTRTARSPCDADHGSPALSAASESWEVVSPSRCSSEVESVEEVQGSAELVDGSVELVDGGVEVSGARPLPGVLHDNGNGGADPCTTQGRKRRREEEESGPSQSAGLTCKVARHCRDQRVSPCKRGLCLWCWSQVDFMGQSCGLVLPTCSTLLY
jgi:hypothetical protein